MPEKCARTENQNTEPKTAVSVTIEDSEAEVTPAKQKKKRERPPPDPTDPAVIAAKAAEHTKGKLFFVLKDTLTFMPSSLDALV